MLQRNHFFLFAEMSLGIQDPLEEELLEQEAGDEPVVLTTPWTFDFGIDKTIEFEQHAKGPILHWNDAIEQTKSIGAWFEIPHLENRTNNLPEQ